MGEETIKKIKQLTDQEKISDLERKIAESNKATQEARIQTALLKIPQSDTKAPDTEFTNTDEEGYIPRLLAYKTLNNLAYKIAQIINKKLSDKKLTFMIVNDMNFTDNSAQLIHVRGMLDYWKNKLKNQLDKYPVSRDKETEAGIMAIASDLILPALPGILGTALDIAKIFQGDYSVNSHTFKETDGAFKARFASELNAGGNKVHIWDFQHIIKSNLSTDLYTCMKYYNDLCIIVNTKKAQGNNEPDIVETEAICKEFSSFYDKLTTISTDGKSPFKKAVISDQIETLGITHFIYFKVMSAGGQSIKKRRLWKSSINYSGGCVVSYYVIDKTGEFIASDTIIDLSSTKYVMNQQNPLKI